MTVSLRRMSAGDGYRYLLRSVAAGDGDRAMSTPLTRYYAVAGTPPGRWLGSGVRVLGGGKLRPGMEVTEEQLALLLGAGRDPVTGVPLGRGYANYLPLRDRVEARAANLDPALAPPERASALARIEAEELAADQRRAVAGYDLTFSVPKSVSVLWALASAPVQERIVAAHHRAIADVMTFFEQEVAATRTGFADNDGAVAQVEVAGVAAAAFDHYDSRAGDPQLHTHVVVSNKVRTTLDGRWRSLDGRPVHGSVVALSAMYNAALADQLTRDLGLEWELRERGVDRNSQWEVAQVGEDLIAEFSSRSHEIDRLKDRLVNDYEGAHGRPPSKTTVLVLRAQATLATRPPKEMRALAEHVASWRTRARRLLPPEVDAWAPKVTCARTRRLVLADEMPDALVAAIGRAVLDQVSTRRSTWTHWNLLAEAHRQTMGIRFTAEPERTLAVGRVVAAAERGSRVLSPPETAFTPASFRRTDGTSVFRPRHATRFSSTTILTAEARLLDRAGRTTAPRIPATAALRVTRRGRLRLSEAQARVVVDIATSGRLVDLLVGPAGAGKTTTMRALCAAWTVHQGRGSVIGLAPTAAAAGVLAADLGIACDNTAKWLHDHRRGATLRTRQLLIIDEATLADTRSLDQITAAAADAGGKVLLVGDPHQLQAVEAGGAFALLVSRRPETPELTEIHRFSQAWERRASLALRDGDVAVIAAYDRHHRLKEGFTDEMLDAAYGAWSVDVRSGFSSVLIAESNQTVQAINDRARAERLLTEPPSNMSGRDVQLSDGARASAGDVVISRRNDRTLRDQRGHWVKNGDRWLVRRVCSDGSLILMRQGVTRSGGVKLPPDYVRKHLTLGYAVTAHQAQGLTVDTAHVLVMTTTTRENLYVAMTRGRRRNTAYVATDQADDNHARPVDGPVSAKTVLYGVLSRRGSELAAHTMIEAEQAVFDSIGRLAAELETIAASAQRGRWVELLQGSGLNVEQHRRVVDSPAFGTLSSALRAAEANHHDLERLVPRIVTQHDLEDANDIAAVLASRLEHAATRPPRWTAARPRLIAGLLPEPLGPMDADKRRAISERAGAIEQRAHNLALCAIRERQPWVQHLPDRRGTTASATAWWTAITAVAAYRDRYDIRSALPTGGEVLTESQRRDLNRIRVAVRRVRVSAADDACAGVVGTTASDNQPTLTVIRPGA